PMSALKIGFGAGVRAFLSEKTSVILSVIASVSALNQKSPDTLTNQLSKKVFCPVQRCLSKNVQIYLTNPAQILAENFYRTVIAQHCRYRTKSHGKFFTKLRVIAK
ncbi:MAG: hypothetical protein ACREFE_10515, partial [Limisphaerales bacterium]